jgi:hypothetical protein
MLEAVIGKLILGVDKPFPRFDTSIIPKVQLDYRCDAWNKIGLLT